MNKADCYAHSLLLLQHLDQSVYIVFHEIEVVSNTIGIEDFSCALWFYILL